MKLPLHLYVIGNGFDIHHEINSSYACFKEWLYKTDPELIQKIDDIYEFCSEEWWSDFENQLASLDIINLSNRISFENAPDLTDEHCDRMQEDAQFAVEYQLESIYSELKKYFHEWIMQLNIPNQSRKIKLKIKDSLFLNFNYTKTLENIYEVDSRKILHIHGCIDDNEDFIIGHGKTYKELEMQNAKKLIKSSENVSKKEITQRYKDYCSNLELHEQWAKDAAFRGVASLRKPVEELIKKHECFFNSLSSVHNIYVYGLSLSEIDIPYLAEIASKAKHGIWEFSYYSKKDKERIDNFCHKYGIRDYNTVQLINLIDKESIIYGKEI